MSVADSPRQSSPERPESSGPPQSLILAKALRDLPTIPQALAAYERERRPRVEKIVAWGARGSSAKVPNGIGRVVRDAFMRFAFRFFITEKAMVWQFDHRVEWDRKLVATAPRTSAPATS